MDKLGSLRVSGCPIDRSPEATADHRATYLRRSPVEVWPGTPYPLGATYDGAGTNFALFSEIAEAVELCLFDANGSEQRIALTERHAHVWHVYLPRVNPGQRYGYRVSRPLRPRARSPLRPQQVAHRPLCQSSRGRDGLGTGLLLL
ncbi:MAG: hypothetical protein WKF73_12230 [Nocardioidaceae bacterium]